MGRMALAMVLALAVSAGIATRNLTNVNGNAIASYTYAFEQARARSIAESGLQVALGQIYDTPSWRTGYTDRSMGNGTFDVVVVPDSAYSTYYWVNATGRYGAQQRAIRALLDIRQIPHGVRAALTAQTDVLHRFPAIIDGRDWLADGSGFNGGAGMPAVSSAHTVQDSAVGASLGGTAGRVDFNPNPVYPDSIKALIVEQNVDWGLNGFPETPAEVLGGQAFAYSDSSLRALAQSGVNGSQYVTSPGDLTFPLSGVTYVDVPEATPLMSEYFGTYSSGILIVHNSEGSATIGDMSGQFRGIIIADRITGSLGSNVRGAVTVLQPQADGPLFLESTWIQFSLEAVLQALGNANDVTRIAFLSFVE